MTLILAGLLIATVVLSFVRLLPWQGRAPRGGRFWLLLALQPICAGLLYLTLVPPPVATEAGTLVVATRNAKNMPAMPGDHLVALPEAPGSADAERLPDLATALRKYPDARTLRIIGEGLEARDRDAASSRAVKFDPAPLPSGLVRLDLPSPVAPGGAFRVSGRTNGTKGTVELVDPAGKRVDAVPLSEGGEFVLGGTVRAAGPAIFRLRVRDPQRKLLQESDVPVWAASEAAPRMLLLGGAPGADVKYLRRWAEDAGLPMHARFSLGGGVAVTDAPIAVNATTLRDLDLVVLDERSWAALGDGERAAVIDAVRGGMGLLLRVTGPVSDATRGQWAALGVNVSGQPTAVTLPPAGVDAEAITARRGETAQDDETVALSAPVRVSASDAAPLLHDAAGKPLGIWRLEGRGRVAVWSVADAYGLVLTGEGDRYGELWSEVFATLSRPGSRMASAPGIARQNQRVAVCALSGAADVIAPDNATSTLLPDPVAGNCAGFWPAVSGWHLVRQAEDDGSVTTTPVYVQPRDALSGVRAAETRDATLRLVSQSAAPAAKTATGPVQRGASWPWFLAWLVSAALLWGLERRRAAKVIPQQTL